MIRIVAIVLPAMLLAGCISQQPVPAVDRSVPAPSRSQGAAQPSGPGYYTVKRGDTLYRIALEHGQDHRDLAAWNNLANPSAIKEGQVLRVMQPGAGESAGEGAVAKPIDTGSGVEARPLDQPTATQAPVASGGLKREPRVGKEPYSDEAYARLNRGGEPAKAAEPKPESRPEARSEAPVAAAPADAGSVAWDWPIKAKADRGFGESGNKGMDFGGKLAAPVAAAADGKVIYAGEALPGYGKLLILKHAEEYNSVYAHNSKLLVKEGDLVKRGQRIAEMGSTGTDSVKLHFEIRKQGKPVDPVQFLPKR